MDPITVAITSAIVTFGVLGFRIKPPFPIDTSSIQASSGATSTGAKEPGGSDKFRTPRTQVSIGVTSTGAKEPRGSDKFRTPRTHIRTSIESSKPDAMPDAIERVFIDNTTLLAVSNKFDQNVNQR